MLGYTNARTGFAARTPQACGQYDPALACRVSPPTTVPTVRSMKLSCSAQAGAQGAVLRLSGLSHRCSRSVRSGALHYDGTFQQGATHSRLDARAQGAPPIVPRLPDMGTDPFGLLLRQRIIFLGGEVNDMSGDACIAQLLMLDAQDPAKDIKFFINSPGGQVTSGMGVYDTMMLCRAEVQTYCFGIAASMGAFLLGAGSRNKRFSMPNSRIMIHQPLGGAQGSATEIEISAREILLIKANINRIMAAYTGQRLDVIERDTDRDRYMSPVEAREYGIIDHVVGGDEATFTVEGSLMGQIGGPERYPAVPAGQDLSRDEQKKTVEENSKKYQESLYGKDSLRSPRVVPTGDPELDKELVDIEAEFTEELPEPGTPGAEDPVAVYDPIRDARYKYQFEKQRQQVEKQRLLNEEAEQRAGEFADYIEEKNVERAEREKKLYEEAPYFDRVRDYEGIFQDDKSGRPVEEQ